MAIAYLCGSCALLLRITIHGDVAPAARVARAAEHADAVEIHGDVPVPVHGDHAPLAAAAAQLLVDELAHRLRERQVPVFHQRADVVGDHLTDEELALSGAGDRAGVIVGVGARTDDGRVADPPAVLVGEPPGGGGGGEMARAVEGHRPHGAAGPGRGRLELAGLTPRLLQLAYARRDRKSTRLNSSHSQISYAVFCLKKKTDYDRHLL